MSMTATDIAAWYAAVVATAAFSWDIIKWFRSGPRLQILVIPNTYYGDSRVVGESVLESGAKTFELEEYCHIEISNVGLQPTTLINISVFSRSKSIQGQISYSSETFAIHVGSKPFPVLLSPGEVWSARIPMNRIDGLSVHGRPTICLRASHREKSVLKVIKMKPKAEVAEK